MKFENPSHRAGDADALDVLTERGAWAAYVAHRILVSHRPGAMIEVSEEGVRALLYQLDTIVGFDYLSDHLNDVLTTEQERKANEAVHQRPKRHHRSTVRQSRDFSFQR